MSADLIGDDACREAFNKARQQRFSVHGLDVVCEPDIFRSGYAAGRDSEIAKRDARIVELEHRCGVYGLELHNATERLQQAERQIKAIKAQEPVAKIALSDDGYKIGLLGALRNHRLPIGTKLYAAPVSEAKAQGVVMPEPDIKTGHGYPAYSVAAVTELFARLNASPVQQDQAFCEYCGGNDEEPQDHCMDCTRPVQQVSVPDERIIPTSAELIQWAWEEEPEETRFQEGYNAAKRWVKMQIEAGIAAPAAPAADACKACKGTGRRPIGGRGRIFGLTNRCFECQPLTAEEVYGDGDTHDQ